MYINRAAGATTGAWPGVQPFGGWKRIGHRRQGGRRPVLPPAVPPRAVPHPRPSPELKGRGAGWVHRSVGRLSRRLSRCRSRPAEPASSVPLPMTCTDPTPRSTTCADRVTRTTSPSGSGTRRSGARHRPGDAEPMLDGAITAEGLGVAAAWDVFESAASIAHRGPRRAAVPGLHPDVAERLGDLDGRRRRRDRASPPSRGSRQRERSQPRTRRSSSCGSWPVCPRASGGAFTFGGSNGNLSALAVARDVADGRRLVRWPTPPTPRSTTRCGCSAWTRSSCRPPPTARFTGAALERRWPSPDAPVSSQRWSRQPDRPTQASSTNSGRWPTSPIEHDAWLHVDGAYGGGALVLAERRHLFDGLGEPTRSSSIRTSGSSARPAPARCCTGNPTSRPPPTPSTGRTSTCCTRAGEHETWNPSDYAFQLTRRACGLPFWFTLSWSRHRRDDRSRANLDHHHRVCHRPPGRSTTRVGDGTGADGGAVPKGGLGSPPDGESWATDLLDRRDRLRRPDPLEGRNGRSTGVPPPADDYRSSTRCSPPYAEAPSGGAKVRPTISRSMPARSAVVQCAGGRNHDHMRRSSTADDRRMAAPTEPSDVMPARSLGATRCGS